MAQPLQRNLHVVDLAAAAVVLALAASNAAEIEAQHGKAKTIQHLHGVINDFVVHRPAKQRMRVGDEAGISRILRPGVQQRFEPPGCARQKQ